MTLNSPMTGMIRRYYSTGMMQHRCPTGMPCKIGARRLPRSIGTVETQWEDKIAYSSSNFPRVVVCEALKSSGGVSSNVGQGKHWHDDENRTEFTAARDDTNRTMKRNNNEARNKSKSSSAGQSGRGGSSGKTTHPSAAAQSAWKVSSSQGGTNKQSQSGKNRSSRNPQHENEDTLRLNKALASMGLASRRGADELVFQGRVAVNGVVVREPGRIVNIRKDEIRFDDKVMTKTAATNKYYFALNKPKGYICTNQGDGQGGSGDRLVVDLFQDWVKEWKRKHSNSTLVPRLFTVGRLDVQSIGLLFVTNDGDWAQKVQHPSSGLTKEYSVTLDRRPGKVELEKMMEGYTDEGNVHVAPLAVSIDDSDPSKKNRIRIIVSEGRNREVRNIVEAAKMDVRVLRRVRVGGYRMPRDLGFGQFVELRPHEVRRVLNIGADRTM